jgi:proline iminopeptidase
MKKIIIIGAASLVVLAVAFGAYFWHTMSKTLYEPGMVHAAKNLRAPLKPPTQTNEIGFWQVETDIKLKYFTAGDGKNILIYYSGAGCARRLDDLCDVL